MINILIRVLSSNMLVTVLKLISGFVFPVMMTTQSYAEYQTFNLYLGYITILSLGFPTGMFIKYGGQPYASIEKSRYKSEVILLTGILCAFTVLFGIINLFFDNRMLLYITICIIPYCVVSAYQSLYQTWGEFHKFAKTHVITGAVPLLGSAVLYILLKQLHASYYVYLFIAVHLAYTMWILAEAARFTHGSKRDKVFDAENRRTLQTGFLICVGNYVNILFTSVGKQVVKLAFDTSLFALFSFGLSLQNIMMVFVTSIAQPMFNFFASGRVAKENFNSMKRLLLLFGACSGIAYHACRFVVSWLVPKYSASMAVTGIYFMAFPALTVINCLYVNLYKLTNQSKQYVITLVKVLVLSLLLNVVAVYAWKDIRSVTAATVVVYYIWFFLDSKRFDGLCVEVRDILFLIAYSLCYLVSMQISYSIIAGLLYAAALIAIGYCFYKETMKDIFHRGLKILTKERE